MNASQSRKLLAGFVVIAGIAASGPLFVGGLRSPPEREMVLVADPTTSRAGPARPAVIRDRVVAAPASPQMIAAKSPELGQWMDQWTKAQLDGKQTTGEQLSQFREIIASDSVSLAQAIDAVCLIASMDGGAKLEPVCDLVVNRAAKELEAYKPPDPKAKPIIDGLLKVQKVLWNARFYKLDQKLIELIRPWEVRGSGHSQMMSYTYAECLQYQGLPGAAYDVFVDAAAEKRMAFEPSEGTNGTLDMEMGKMLFLLGRYAEATEHLKVAAAQNNSGYTGDILAFLALSLVRQNKLDDARPYIAQFYERKCSSVLEMQMLAEFGARSEKYAAANRSKTVQN